MLEPESHQIKKCGTGIVKGTPEMTFKTIFEVISKKLSRCPRVLCPGSSGDKQNAKFFISREPLIVETLLTSHFNQKRQVSISVSYIVYPSD